MTARTIDQVLRSEGRFAAGRRDLPATALIALVLGASTVYGACLGSRELVGPQILYSAIKLPLLLLGSTLICLPNFYVINALLGLGEDFKVAVRGILAALAATSLCLLGLSPLCVLAYVSGCDYRGAVLLNGVYCAAATWGGQVILSRHYRKLVARNPKHRVARRSWWILFVFVTIQMAWSLRPFVGWSGEDPTFLRSHSHLRNAYVVLAEQIWKLFFG